MRFYLDHKQEFMSEIEIYSLCCTPEQEVRPNAVAFIPLIQKAACKDDKHLTIQIWKDGDSEQS